jgi:quercetin dioxygenase-like cupin family protein
MYQHWPLLLEHSKKEKLMSYLPSTEELLLMEETKQKMTAQQTSSRVIENPIIKDRITFIKTAEDTNGEYLLAKLEVAPGGGNPMHYHTTFTEEFIVIDGQLNVSLNGEEKVLKVGESALIPKMAHHRFYNVTDKYATAMLELRPARNFEKSLRIAYGLARDGKTNKKALPKSIWHLALLFQLGEGYIPGLPLPIQRGMFGTLASIAKLLGKDKELEKYV